MMLQESAIVRDIMQRDFPQVHPDASLPEAERLLHETGDESLPVVEKGRLVGVVTPAGITYASNQANSVKSVMTPSIVFCYADQSLEEARKAMAEFKVHRLLV